MGMVIGYWDTHGYDQLIPGNATDQDTNRAVDQAISSSHSTGAGNQSYEGHALPLDYSPPAQPDMSSSVGFPADAHTSDCLADFDAHTSWSADNNCYGWS